MSQFTNTTGGYRGLVVPDFRIVPETRTEGAFQVEEAGPRPGQAIPGSSDTEAVVKTSGVQTSVTYDITCLRSGFTNTGEYGFNTNRFGLVDDLLGCDYPNLCAEMIHIGGGVSGTAATGGWPESIRTSSGRVVWLWGRTVTATSTQAVYASYSDDGLTVIGADATIAIIAELSSASTYIGYTIDNVDCVCGRWDDIRGVVQCWVRVVDPINSMTQFVLFESSDEAVTWTLVQRNCLTVPYNPDYTLRKPVVGLIAGTLVLLQPEDDGTNYTITQFTSRDKGRSFDILSSDASDYTKYTAVEFNGKLQLAAISISGDDLFVLTLNSAYDLVLTAAWEEISAMTNVGYIALAVQHGRLWLYGVPIDMHRIDVVSSLTGDVDDWQPVGHGLLNFVGSGSNVDFNKMTAVGAFGGVMLAFKASDTGVTSIMRDHLYAIRCGEWRTVTMARVPPFAGYREGRAGFGVVSASVSGTEYAVDVTTWYPFLAPDALTGTTWTASGAGTDAGVLSTGSFPYWGVTCTAGQARYWTQTFDEDMAKGILVYFSIEMPTGGATGSTDSAVRITLSDGTTEYKAELRLTATDSVYLYDATSTTNTRVLFDELTTKRSFMVFLRETDPGVEATVCVYYKSNFIGSKHWARAHAALTLAPNTATPATDSSVSFGVLNTSSAVTIQQRWHTMCFLANAGTPGVYDPCLGTIIGDTDQVAGAPMSAQLSEIELGLNIGFTGGPAKFGDTWTIAPKYDYAKEHIYPHLYPSPRQTWRTTEDTYAAETIWTPTYRYSGAEGLGSAAWCVTLIGVNFAEWKLEGLGDAGKVTILDVNSSAEFTGLPYRAGVHGANTSPYVTVDTGGSGAATRYIHENELVGGTVAIGAYRFKILRNTSGYWSTAVGKKPVLFLESWNSAVPSTGSLAIWPPSVCVIKNGLASTEYRQFIFTISSQATADGYYEIGQFIFGGVTVWGKQYSHGRVLTRSANVGTFSTAGGVNNTVRNGPTFRTAEFGWFEGIDQTDIYEASSSNNPDYVTMGDTATIPNVVASRYDTATQIDGLYGAIDGPMQPVVYIAYIPYNADETVQHVLTAPDSFLYGRTQGNITRTTVRGTENVSEIAQIAAISIKEDV